MSVDEQFERRNRLWGRGAADLDLRNELNATEAAQWIPLDKRNVDSFPEPLVCVIAFDSFTKISGQATWDQSIGWVFAGMLKDDVVVTHWMPMPKGPVGS